MLSSWFFEFADLFLKNEQSAALLTQDGEILHSKSDLGFEVTGLKNIAESSLKYIALKPGEILITNDSYSGGSFLHRYTFLMPLSRAEGNNPGVMLCVRREFAAGLNVSDKLDNEGLRIPPTPIFQNGQLITPIIDAMSMHPLCPQGFQAWLQQTVTEMGEHFKKWSHAEKSCKFPFTAAEFKKFLTFSKNYTTEKIFEKAQGDARSEVHLDSGEILKLHLEINNGIIKADFGGTTPGIKTHVPDLATFGACYEALAQFYGLHCVRNSGSFSVLQVTKPLGCFLNAKYPASTHQGMQTGVAAVRMAMTLALRQIVKSTEPLLSENALAMEVSFQDGQRWLSRWSSKVCCESVSLEKIEAQHPVQFVRVEKNPETMHMGLEFKTLASCQVRWLSDFTKHSLRAPKGLKAPESTQIEILNGQGEWTRLASQGTTDLAPGTSLRVNLWGQFQSL